MEGGWTAMSLQVLAVPMVHWASSSRPSISQQKWDRKTRCLCMKVPGALVWSCLPWAPVPSAQCLIFALWDKTTHRRCPWNHRLIFSGRPRVVKTAASVSRPEHRYGEGLHTAWVSLTGKAWIWGGRRNWAQAQLLLTRHVILGKSTDYLELRRPHLTIVIHTSGRCKLHAKCAAATQPSNSTPRDENIRSHRNQYTDVYSNFICNGPKLETTQMPVNGWRMVLGNKQGKTHWYTQPPPGWTSRESCKVETANAKSDMLYVSLYNVLGKTETVYRWAAVQAQEEVAWEGSGCVCEWATWGLPGVEKRGFSTRLRSGGDTALYRVGKLGLAGEIRMKNPVIKEW